MEITIMNEAMCCTPTSYRDALASLRLDRFLPPLDRVWLAIAMGFVLIGIFAPGQLAASAGFTLSGLWHIAPFLLFSAALAGYLQAARADQVIGRVFGHRLALAIGAAAVFGALSPFCSCGVIPLIAALLAGGVPLAAVMAFWVSSPIMSPSMFVVTAAGLGLGFALVKTASAIAIGLLAGGATLALQRSGFFRNVLRAAATGQQCGSCKSEASVSGKDSVWPIWREPGRVRVMLSHATTMTFFLAKWLTLAFLLESLMIAFLPPQVFGQWLSGDHAIVLSALVGVPAYLNGFVAVPVVAGLIENGMAPGAALSFMLAGAMTSIPAAIAVYSLVKKALFGWYLAIALCGAVAAGGLYQWVLGMM
jgi:uncharacterized membrane protein YraQ (UPF0718 family)